MIPRAGGPIAPHEQAVAESRVVGGEVIYVEDDELDLRRLWEIVFRRRWLILTIILASLLVTALATYLTAPVYRATATLQINKESVKILQYQDVTPAETDIFDQDFLQTQYELLQSRTLAKRVIDQLSLYDNSDFNHRRDGRGILEKLGLAPRDAEDRRDPELLVDDFLLQLSIEPVKRSRLVRIHFHSTSPQLAASVARTLAENFINLNLERRFDASSYAKNFIADRIRQLKVKLEDSERKLVQYARKAEIVHLDDKQPIVVQQLAEISSSVAKAEQERVAAEAVYRELQQGQGRVFSGVLANPVVQQLKQEVATLESEYDEKLRIYKPAYPAMQQMRDRINSIKTKIEAEIAEVTRAYESDYLAAARKQERLEQRLAELKHQALDLQDSSITYGILQREVDTNRQLYEGLLQRLKEVGVAGGIGANNISVVDYPETPRKRYKPSMRLNMVMALIVSLLAAVAIAFLVEYFDDTVKSVDVLESRSQLPVLGIIPDVRAFHQEAQGARQVGLLSYSQPDSVLAEAFRSTRTSLMFSGPDGAPAVLQVTSPNPGEGKTTAAVNIATAFGQMNSTVLLIDADLRNPSLHHVLGLSNETGLTNLLVGNAGPAEISRYTGIGKVFAIPAGPIPPNPAELLVGNRMRDLLALAREKFDHIIVDGPPVMGLADALILANQVQGTLLVAESASTRYRDMDQALRRLRGTNARLLGWVLSKHRAGPDGYGYHSYYYYNGDKNLSASALS